MSADEQEIEVLSYDEVHSEFVAWVNRIGGVSRAADVLRAQKSQVSCAANRRIVIPKKWIVSMGFEPTTFYVRTPNKEKAFS